jgi:DNA-binding SARP family transcriptional activator/tetratricopeptide (TPR) repeat protein
MGQPEASARIYLLGRFGVEVDGETIPASSWRKRRPIEVLAALALAPGRVLHREELIDRLWPNKDLEAGANNLHRALHDLRRVTNTDLVALDRGVARLVETAWVDVYAFEQAAASASKEGMTQAMELYHGALLPDDPYSDALAARREGLRQRFIDAALRLAKLHQEAREPEPCVTTLRRILTQDPALEPAHQLLMRVLAETGRTGDALRQFGECSTALRERFDTVPSRATFDLRSAIERGELAPTVAGPAMPAEERRAPPQVTRRLLGAAASRAMHGRAKALEAVRGFVEGERGVLLVVGEAGLGKTRLAGECVRLVSEAAGGAALIGLGLDQDSGVPYAPFADAWAHHRRTTVALDVSDPFLSFAPSGGSAQEDRLRLFQSVERAIEALGRDKPVCIVIENLHQADQSSLHLFHHLARATRTLPLLLVGTLRGEEVPAGSGLHTLLGGLARERLATRIDLEPIDLEATGHLVAELSGGAVAADLAAAVHTLAEGNPFHTEEVVQAMREDGSSRPTIPANLLDTVRQRVRRLGREAERFLAAAAIVGQRFPFEVARVAAGLEPELALAALDVGIEARILEEEAGEVRFRHALTRQALFDALTNARRVYLHRAVADAIEQVGSARREVEAETLAFHHEAAGQLDRALPYLLAAGDRAQSRLGFTEAVAFFERALGLMDATGRTDGEDRFRVLRMMGGMRMALSDLDGAVRDLDAAAALQLDGFRPTATQIAMVSRVAALALIQGGRLDEAGKRLDDALLALDGSKNDPELPAVLYLFAQLRWHEEKFAEAKELAARSLAEAEARGDRRAMAKGHEMLALACHSLGAWQEGQAHEQERQALADGTLDVDQAFDVHLCLWEYHLYGEQGAAQIRTAVDQTLEQARRMKAPRAVALCENFGGMLDFQAGRWSEAEAQLRQAVERFRQVGSASGEAISLQRLAVLLTARGDLEAARALLDEGLIVGGRAAMRSHCLTRIHSSLVRNRLAARDRDAARASLEEGLAEAARHGHCATCSALLLPEAVRVALACENLAEAESFAGRLDDIARRFASRAWTAMAEQTRGRVLAACGDVEAAFDAFERARVGFEAIGCPYEAARCVMAQSRVFAGVQGKRAKQRRRASDLADSAQRVFASLGAADLEA